MCHRHGIYIAFTFQLDHVRAKNVEFLFIHHTVGRPAKLQRRQTRAMYHGADMFGSGIERGPYHPPYFAVLFNTFAYKFSIAAEDNITLDFFPYKMELVMVS